MSHTFTVFCQEPSGSGTIWIGTVTVPEPDVDQAIEAGRQACAEDWNREPKDVHVLGVVLGEAEICYWEDITA